MFTRHSQNGEVREEKPLPSWLTSVIPASVVEKIPAQSTSKHDSSQDYLTGLRGVLAIMAFLWAYMVTFAPAAVAHSSNDTGPDWQIALRKTLSVLFWNDSMIYSSFIFLSARTICLPFLLDSTKLTLASCVFRRGLRMWFPTAAALIVVYAVWPTAERATYLTTFATLTQNSVMTAHQIYIFPNSLANFNGIFEIFWVSHDFSYQGGIWAFPTQTLWIVSALFQQSYTVYMVMVIVPYTRKSWRLWGAAVFISTAWWVYSWAWFSVSGLLIADAVVNMDLKAKCQAHRLPVFIAAATMLAGGYFMCFYWVDARPDLENAEIDYHTGPYSTGGVYTWNDSTAPELRADNYLVICGFYLLLESTDFLQLIFRNPVFVFIGKRSYSYFLLQSTIIYAVGIKLAMGMFDHGSSLAGYDRASGVAFIVSLLVTLATGELFYWLIDLPSQRVGRFLFTWIRE